MSTHPRPFFRRIPSLLTSLCLVALMATAGLAQDTGTDGGKTGGGDGKPGQNRYRQRLAQQAPELDPATAGAALTLILGGLAVLTDRRRRPA